MLTGYYRYKAILYKRLLFLPQDIAIDEEDNIAYVASRDSDTVSVIEKKTDGNYSNIENFEFREINVHNPTSIAIDELDKVAYVVNRDSDTVSVINGTNFKNIANVSVGNYPTLCSYGISFSTCITKRSASSLDDRSSA